jgi:uncharacterized protein
VRSAIESAFATLILCCFIATSGTAGPLEDGINAALRGDWAKALRDLQPLAEQGDATAQYNLGVIYGKPARREGRRRRRREMVP